MNFDGGRKIPRDAPEDFSNSSDHVRSLSQRSHTYVSQPRPITLAIPWCALCLSYIVSTLHAHPSH
jgi:hypothetical protein